MSMLSTSPMGEVAAVPAVPRDFIWRLSVNQYHEMVRAGILTEEDPVELLEGWLVYKMPKNPIHRLATQSLREILEGFVAEGWHVNVQEPITIAASEPEPDISVVRGSRYDYKDRHPGAADLGLVIEVSDATLERDQGWKKKIYARAGIPVYWIVNLVAGRIEVYHGPGGSGEAWDYQAYTSYERNQAVPFSLGEQILGSVSLEQLLNG